MQVSIDMVNGEKLFGINAGLHEMPLPMMMKKAQSFVEMYERFADCKSSDRLFWHLVAVVRA